MSQKENGPTKDTVVSRMTLEGLLYIYESLKNDSSINPSNELLKKIEAELEKRGELKK